MFQPGLFKQARQHFDLPDALIWLEPEFLSTEEAAALFQDLHQNIPWRQDSITLYGRTLPLPRLTQWYGEPGSAYTYSGIRMEPLPFLPEIFALKNRLEAHLSARFNSVLANLYRTGADCVHWHADDEPELGTEPIIASISLGASRSFRLKHKTRAELEPISIELPSGSLLLMAGKTQSCWLHTIPPRMKVDKPRVNLTFRYISTNPF
jgi:alkylated DNA repair dioxygenase AlkB